ncbi:sensor histidine kinase [Enterococcus sp. AZ109]|uniref:sensor histidine kinase n=1 Tax=Enterococcus sp. AZ109 TaxID=2774634 RepID=UPI003F1F5A7B
MAKRKPISLTNYVTRILLAAFAIIFLILLMALVGFQLLIQFNLITPANAGETAARAEIDRLRQAGSFTGELNSQLYEYVYFDQEGQVQESSLTGNALKQAIERHPAEDVTYATGAYVSFPDGSRCLFTWRYTAYFTNEILQRLLPSAEVTYLSSVGLVLLLFLVFYTRSISKKLRQKLVLVEAASQQIAQQNLETPIPTTAGIREFNQVLHSMENLREALKTSLLKQWETQQQRTQEIAALTHDIKTPLTVINGNAELLLEDPLDTETKQLVQAIHNSGTKAQHYVSTLQQVANFDLISYEKEPLAVDSLIRELVAALSPLAKAKNIQLSYNYDQPLQKITGSAFMLSRALNTLGENAIRYTDTGTVTIQVKQTDNETHFCFEDQGPGFTSEALQHATEMFWQQDKSRTGDNNYGIGLALAKKAAQQHNGQLVLENTENGARVTLAIKNNASSNDPTGRS